MVYRIETVPLNIKNAEVERLAEEVASLAGETKTEAIRRALLARLEDLRWRGGDRRARLRRFLETEAWPAVPPDQLGRRLTRAEEEELLGLGPEGA